MPLWQNQPPADKGRSGYRLLRTPTAHALTAYVLSDNLVGCNTHYVGNRTIPCETPNCDSCNNSVPWRWHGYLAILIQATQEVAIFECTARAAETFAAYFQRYSTTRGALFKAQRLNGRANGRVLIQAKPADLAKVNLPKCPPVEKLLCHIWNIPEAQVSASDNRPRPPFKNAQVDRTKEELPLKIDTRNAVNAALAKAIKHKDNGAPKTP